MQRYRYFKFCFDSLNISLQFFKRSLSERLASKGMTGGLKRKVYPIKGDAERYLRGGIIISVPVTRNLPFPAHIVVGNCLPPYPWLCHL